MSLPDDAAAPLVRRLGRNLPVAIGVGVTLAVLFLGTLAWNPYAFLTFIAAAVVLGIVELDKALRSRDLRPATPVVVVAGLVMIYGAYRAGAAGQALGLVLLLLGCVAWALWDSRRDRAVAGLAAGLLMGVWAPLLASFIGLLLARDDGDWYVMATVALTVTSDIGGLGFGYGFGRRKLAPSISPAKTWEGFAGSLFTVLLLAGLLTARLPGFDLLSALVLGAGVCLAATAGDLAESMVKRDLGVKDLGGILPGHGGIMDRADAILFALPVAHILLTALGR